jgi:hypothetical protein
MGRRNLARGDGGTPGKPAKHSKYHLAFPREPKNRRNDNLGSIASALAIVCLVTNRSVRTIQSTIQSSAFVSRYSSVRSCMQLSTSNSTLSLFQPCCFTPCKRTPPVSSPNASILSLLTSVNSWRNLCVRYYWNGERTEQCKRKQ